MLLTSIPLAPLFAAIALLLLRRSAGWITVAATSWSFIALLLLAGTTETAEVSWIALPSVNLHIGLRLDGLSWWVALLVSGVAALVNLYSTGSAAEEPDRARFFTWMAFFAGAMLTLVLSSSLLLLYVAWEAVGLASFALIAFHYKDEDARRAARKAFLMTRFGDTGLLVAILLILVTIRTVQVDEVLAAVAAGRFEAATLTLIALLLFLGAAGKSAQLPFTAWLPDAMAGPSPVSALIHSATMVAAGVYLVLRLYPLFEAAPLALHVVLWTGAATALLAALAATAQHDLKRVLAWSTVSQLGEMMLALGLGAPLAAAFHLTTHAIFKCGLFLAAGAVQHEVGTRDLRKLGGLRCHMPLTAGVFATCALALAGLPPFAGFWSEDEILRRARDVHFGWELLILGLIALSGVYIGRATAATFGKWPGQATHQAHDSRLRMATPMLVLACGAAVAGLALRHPIERVLPFDTGSGNSGWPTWLTATSVSLAGLLFGVWRVSAHGPTGAFGAWPRAMAGSVQVLQAAPARAALLLSHALQSVEQWADRSTRGVAAAAVALGTGAGRSESALDRASSWSVEITLKSASAARRIDDGGFSWGVDRFADSFHFLGDWLRVAQTGKLYAYTAGVFVWVLIASLALSIFWM